MRAKGLLDAKEKLKEFNAKRKLKAGGGLGLGVVNIAS